MVVMSMVSVMVMLQVFVKVDELLNKVIVLRMLVSNVQFMVGIQIWFDLFVEVWCIVMCGRNLSRIVCLVMEQVLEIIV